MLVEFICGAISLFQLVDCFDVIGQQWVAFAKPWAEWFSSWVFSHLPKPSARWVDYAKADFILRFFPGLGLFEPEESIAYLVMSEDCF